MSAYGRKRTLAEGLWQTLMNEKAPATGPLLIGAPGGIRTPDLLVRSQPLYPTELRARETVVTL